MIRVSFLAVLFIVLMGCGCSTIATLSVGENSGNFHCDEEIAVTRVYSGVSNDIRFLRGEYADKGIIFWDLPFSFALDTVALPYTIYAQNKFGNICN